MTTISNRNQSPSGNHFPWARPTTALILLECLVLAGCAHIDFEAPKGLVYYEPKPYMFVSITPDCVSTATLHMIPANQKKLMLKSGYGTSKLSVKLTNGIVTDVGQDSDTKIPETLTAIATLGTSMAAMRGFDAVNGKPTCIPTAKLYPIEAGVPNGHNEITFPIEEKKPPVTRP